MRYNFSYRLLFKITLFTYISLLGLKSYSQGLENISNYSTKNFFIENKGQDHPDIKYRLDHHESTLLLRKDGYSYSLFDFEKYSKIIKNQHDGIANEDLTINNHLIHQTFLNTHNPTIFSKEKTSTLTNYIKGNDPSKWGIGILPSSEVYYDELYKGIDLRYISLSEEVKYELIVEPYAKTNQISFNYIGQDSIYIDDYGRLILTSSLGTVTEDPPYIYQKIDDEIIEIKSSYKLKNGKVTYKIGKYNHAYELIIDPNLIFSTYTGASSDNWGNTACYDNEGNLYAGSTVFLKQNLLLEDDLDGSFIYTSGAYQIEFQGGDIDMGIIKFNSTGTNALYATYYGGNSSEVPISMITDTDNNLYILSVTSSINLISSNEFNGGGETINLGYRFTNGTDIYITKLDEQGQPVISRYFGGSKNDGVADLDYKLRKNYKNQLRGDIALDENNHIIIASYTESDGLGLNSFNDTKAGLADGIIAKFDDNLEPLWCGYVGADSSDVLFSLDLDSNNDIFTCGITVTDTITNNITAKIPSDGSSIKKLIYGTEYNDEAYFVRVGPNNNVYVTGQTEGSYPINNAGFEISQGGNFIHAFSNDLEDTIFTTTFGIPNKQNLVPSALLVDECNRIYFTGWSNNYTNYRTDGIRGLQTTPDALKDISEGYDFYLMVLESNANNLLYASYIGGLSTGEHLDGGMSRFSPNGTVYQSVCTGCEITCLNNDCYDQNGDEIAEEDNFPLYPNSPNTIFPRQKGTGSCNNAVFKFDLSNSKAEIKLDETCQSSQVVLQNNSFGATNFTWSFGDGKSTNTLNAEDVSHNYLQSGEYTIILTAESITSCDELLKDSITIFITSNEDTQVIRDTLCEKTTLKTDFYTDTTLFNYTWINASSNEIDNDKVANPTLQLTQTKDYLIEISDSFGCTKIDTFSVLLPIIEQDVSIKIVPSCSQDITGTLLFDNKTTTSGTTSNPNYIWTINNEITTDKTPETITYIEPDSVNILLEIELETCSYDTSFTAIFTDVVYPNVITPNGDGKNDTYKIVGIEDGQWKVTFTNRWGKEIFKSEDYKNDFGNNLSEGTYYYLITSPDNTQCKGWLQVVK